MKQKTLFVLLFLVFSTVLVRTQAQNLIIRQNDGTEISESLSTVENLKFSVDDLLVALKSGATSAYGLSTIDKLYFDMSTSVEEPTSLTGQGLSLFPNPAATYIVVQGIPKGTPFVSLYSADGRLIRQITVSSEKETLDIGTLKNGLYFLIANGRSSKFIKL